MSKSEIIKYACPQCSRKTRFEIWKSVNVMLNPELRWEIMNDTLLKFRCKRCGFEQDVAYALLYHDQLNKHMIWWLPTLKEEETFQPEPSHQMLEMALHNYRLRVVNTYNKLKEKILIFESGLDDRAIEILKRYMWDVRLRDQGIAYEWIFFIERNIVPIHTEVVFSISPPGQEAYQIRIGGPGGYTRASDILYRVCGVPKDEITKWRIVDRDYSDLAQMGRG